MDVSEADAMMKNAGMAHAFGKCLPVGLRRDIPRSQLPNSRNLRPSIRPHLAHLDEDNLDFNQNQTSAVSCCPISTQSSSIKPTAAVSFIQLHVILES